MKVNYNIIIILLFALISYKYILEHFIIINRDLPQR